MEDTCVRACDWWVDGGYKCESVLLVGGGYTCESVLLVGGWRIHV